MCFGLQMKAGNVDVQVKFVLYKRIIVKQDIMNETVDTWTLCPKHFPSKRFRNIVAVLLLHSLSLLLHTNITLIKKRHN